MVKPAILAALGLSIIACAAPIALIRLPDIETSGSIAGGLDLKERPFAALFISSPSFAIITSLVICCINGISSALLS